MPGSSRESSAEGDAPRCGMSAPSILLANFADGASLARAAAADWLKALEGAARRGGAYCVALFGGRIARQFLLAAAGLLLAPETAARAGELLERVHFFWGDERCVPPEDPESNFRLARECWLGPLGIPAERVHRVRGEAPPPQAAAAAAAELRRWAAVGAGGQPALDLVFLGLGEEGHVASLFPGEPEEVMASAAVYRPVVVPKPPPERITLGYPALVAAREVWVLAAGPGKGAALRASLEPTGATPMARLLRQRSSTRIFTDAPPAQAR